MFSGDCSNALHSTVSVACVYWGSEFDLVILPLSSYLDLFRRLIVKYALCVCILWQEEMMWALFIKSECLVQASDFRLKSMFVGVKYLVCKCVSSIVNFGEKNLLWNTWTQTQI